ncbi:2OG-Fe(II) oxygenase, partial [Streptomyces sp. MnatMP-M17]|uniref:2OG-Fe(II) oxygenase n=1 Tax=unclassified Streptomyces TaxID=2593676 RepID=UPI002109EDDA
MPQPEADKAHDQPGHPECHPDATGEHPRDGGRRGDRRAHPRCADRVRHHRRPDAGRVLHRLRRHRRDHRPGEPGCRNAPGVAGRLRSRDGRRRRPRPGRSPRSDHPSAPTRAVEHTLGVSCRHTEPSYSLNVHNDGDFYRSHQDTSAEFAPRRLLTFVYYLHRTPRPFGGGELRVFDAAL